MKTIELHLQEKEFINSTKILYKINEIKKLCLSKTSDNIVCQISSEKKYCVQSFPYVGQLHKMFTLMAWQLNKYLCSIIFLIQERLQKSRNGNFTLTPNCPPQLLQKRIYCICILYTTDTYTMVTLFYEAQDFESSASKTRKIEFLSTMVF